LSALHLSTNLKCQNTCKVAANDYPLDLADNSVDDMYEGCEDKMSEKVEKEFLENEKNTNEIFRAAWNEAEKQKMIAASYLNKPELLAIFAYTQTTKEIPPVLNKAVREQGPEYKTTFKYHSLHFFLTSAIKKNVAKKEKNDPGKCYTAYRRTNVYFTQDVSNKEMRFGHFASSSLHSLESSRSKKMANVFGEKSCFVIETCFGADISMYSKFGAGEAEILIPPYEVFKVTNSGVTGWRELNSRLSCSIPGKLLGAFFYHFQFTITYRPGSRNIKPDALSQEYSPPNAPPPLSCRPPASLVILHGT
uniref:NAD(P)(+)--arginine ADP-ribosyltransferase n=1 Tax=Oryzias latipes TaxID=8090 RepID=A0A3P9IKA7_ORYLA